MRLAKLLSGFAAIAALALSAFAGDILSEYQSRYTKAAGASVKEDVIRALVATGKPEAMKALQWCAGVSKTAIEDATSSLEKARAALAPVVAKIIKKQQDWADQLTKQGKPLPDKRPRFPEDDEVLPLEADVADAEKLVAAQRSVLNELLDAHGALVAKLPPEAQKAVRDDWQKNRIGSKDWLVRAEGYELLGHVATDWATEMLTAAVSPATNTEPDPRALVIAVDGLAGRDAAKVGPVLAARMEDVRWLVRAAVVAALEKTPSKEGIDAIVKRMVKEDGRLKDDCCRALKALTGQDLAANPEIWRVWWEQNRDKWTGKPPAEDPDKVDPFKDLGKKPAEADRRTGFFGIQIESKRVVFVIDISGSMNAKMGGNGPDAKSTRAELAREELKRVVAALEDGTIFNIVFFSSGVRVWKPDMQKADGKSRGEALQFIAGVEFAGGTNTYDALEAAFALGDMGKGKKRESDPTGDARVDTIVFLSDGKPSVGKVTDPDLIRTAVKDWNRSRRIAIHAVAFVGAATSKDGNEGADPAFMKGLAADTGGKCVEK
jgi:von Willebrand factor type A domain